MKQPLLADMDENDDYGSGSAELGAGYSSPAVLRDVVALPSGTPSSPYTQKWDPHSHVQPSASRLTVESDLLPILLTLSVCQGGLLFGYHVGFSSPTEENVEADAGLSSSQGSLMFSLLNVGAMAGALAAGKVADTLGRRIAVLSVVVPFTSGALVFAFWVSYAGLIIGRILAGFGVGYSSVMVPLYIAEIAPTRLRGTLGTINQLSVSFGIFLVNTIGLPIVDHPHFWKAMMLLSLIFVSLQFFPLLFFGPETPRWLVNRGRIEDAKKSLMRLRGPKADISTELDDLLGKKRTQPSDGSSSEPEARTGIGALFDARNRYPLAIGIGVVLLQQWSGINAFVFNTKKLFEGENALDNKASQIKALHGAIIVNAVQVAFTGLSAVLMDKRGRRFFLLLSSIGMAVSCTAMGFAFHADAAESIKIAVVVLYFAFFALGLGPVPWIICGEIFPAASSGLFVSVATVVNWTSSFLVTLSFNRLNKAFTSSGTFWFYGGVCTLGAVLVYFFVPETKGKSLEEIQELFASLRNKKKDQEQSSLLDRE